MTWLKPFMHERRARAGDVLFRKGDPASEMFYTMTGRFCCARAVSSSVAGALVGELGLLSPGAAADADAGMHRGRPLA